MSYYELLLWYELLVLVMSYELLWVNIVLWVIMSYYCESWGAADKPGREKWYYYHYHAVESNRPDLTELNGVRRSVARKRERKKEWIQVLFVLVKIVVILCEYYTCGLYYKTAVLLKVFDFSHLTCSGVKSVVDIFQNPFGYVENKLLAYVWVTCVVCFGIGTNIFRCEKKILFLWLQFKCERVFWGAEHCPYVCFTLYLA